MQGIDYSLITTWVLWSERSWAQTKPGLLNNTFRNLLWQRPMVALYGVIRTIYLLPRCCSRLAFLHCFLLVAVGSLVDAILHLAPCTHRKWDDKFSKTHFVSTHLQCVLMYDSDILCLVTIWIVARAYFLLNTLSPKSEMVSRANK